MGTLKKVCSRGVIDTGGSNFGDFWIDFLGEYEAICETASARESGRLGGIVWWKNRGSKISWHCSFKWTDSQDFQPLIFSSRPCWWTSPLCLSATYSKDSTIVWSWNRIFFYFAKYEITTKVILISAKFRCTLFREILRNNGKFREISYKLFREIVSLCKFFKSNT
jgi:hypothetical protein